MAGYSPPNKKAKSEEFIGLINDRSDIERISATLNNYRDIFKAVEILSSKEQFCFIKLKNCNAAYPVDFSKAWCAGVRNIEEDDDTVWRTRVRFCDLFDLDLLQNLLLNPKHVTLNRTQMMLCDKLIQFLANINDVSKILENNKQGTDTEWTAVFVTHVLRPLALMNSVLMDESGNTRMKECPCGCKSTMSLGDTSMGHEDVWHGSVEILLGTDVAICYASEDSEQQIEERESTFNALNSESVWQCIIAQTIVFSFVKNMGVVPTIAISKQVVKIFMYDPDHDLLFESTQMKLFPDRGKQVLNIHTVLALWFVVNYCHFCTGTKPSHVDFGYKADFQKSLDQVALSTYKNKLHFWNCKNCKEIRKEFSFDSYEDIKFL